MNLLSKLDLIESYGPLAFNLDFYTDVPDPSRLLPYMREAAWRDGGVSSSTRDAEDGPDGGASRATSRGLSAFASKYMKLSEAICELVDDFGLVGFGAIAISDSETVARALRSIDKANGYCFGARDERPANLFGCAAGEMEWDDERVGSLQERFMSRPLDEEHAEDDGASDGDVWHRRPVEERHMTEEDLRDELLPPGAHRAHRRSPRKSSKAEIEDEDAAGHGKGVLL